MSQARKLTPEEIEQRRKAGKIRALAFTTEYQQAARAKLPKEYVQLGAQRGGAATIRRHGREVFERLRQYRLTNPSSPERALMQILAELGFTDYEREYQPELDHAKTFLCALDFAWPATRTAIEVDGKIHTKSFAEARQNRYRDHQRKLWLDLSNWSVMTIDKDELDDETTHQRIQQFLEVMTCTSTQRTASPF